eukprot:CAMPEP_0197421304 /NCGR_PEP_ID=MMETSP1170-20131217/6626_1 /TAXON_ID=54406 /ORGANISM="Sarcinochrysis sp, Strain CCMP770" /LENGTH=56 /DNA_ID=CAMNT_0042948529 /DNA_START=25 /DNA_END=190 /DNA_ORIENTATION=+
MTRSASPENKNVTAQVSKKFLAASVGRHLGGAFGQPVKFLQRTTAKTSFGGTVMRR